MGKDEEVEEGVDFLSAVNPDGTFDAALLMRPTGSIVAGWMRESDRCEVVGVMTATLLASINMIAESVGCRAPTTVSVRCEESQLLATKVDDNAILVLIAPADTREAHLRRKTRHIVARLGDRSRFERTGDVVTATLATHSMVAGRDLASGNRKS